MASLLPVLLIAAIPRTVTEVSRLAKRPRSGLALIRRTRLRQSCGEEDGSSSLEDRLRALVGELRQQPSRSLGWRTRQ